MAASVNDKLTATFNSANPNVARVTSSRTAGSATLACDNLAGWPTVTKVHFATYQIDADNAVVEGTQIDWYGIVSGNNIGSLTRLAGATDAGNSIGDVVEMMPTGSWAQGIYDWGTQFADTQGNLLTAAVQEALSLGADSLNGWNALGFAPNTVTYNGHRSYDLVFNTQDLTGTLSPGMRLRTTRTVAAPTQCTSLNGTSQYYSKAAPAGMTFTDDFVAGAWVKLSSYPTVAGTIISRDNGSSGWALYVLDTGQIQLIGYNAAAGNNSLVKSYQSIPLNKWVHVAAQLDMSTFTATTTTSYIMVDGTDVPVSVTRNGTNPTALVQAGNLEVGSHNGGLLPLPGKIAQAFVSSAKITQANVRTLYSQGLTSALISTHNIISAYSFSNSINDLNTTNANNLTASGSAVATNADSPFGTQASGSISSTLDYAVITAATFSTNTTITVRVPEGNTIPTSGGVSSVVYSSSAFPYGFPGISNILAEAIYGASLTTIATGAPTAVAGGQLTVTLPANKRVKISVKPYSLQTSGGTPQVAQLAILDGSTQIANESGIITNSSNSMAGFEPVAKFHTGAGGAKTYNIAACAANAGTTTITSATTALTYFTLELEQPL